MEIRADLTRAAVVAADDWEWIPSPQAGVERGDAGPGWVMKWLWRPVSCATQRIPVSRAMSMPWERSSSCSKANSVMSTAAIHAGTYVRNPPGSRHVPFSEPGCLIWVKLRQFQTDDLTQTVSALNGPIPASGQARRDLHEHGEERVAEIVAAKGEGIVLSAAGHPQELLVMEGEIASEANVLGRWGWLRIPAGVGVTLTTAAPTRLFWKIRPET